MSPSRRRRRASPEWEGREVITVAALPGRGLYVRHLGHPEGVDGVHRPTVLLPGAPPRRSASFEPHWLSDHLDDFHLVHVHGLPPRQSPAETAHSIDLVQRARLPLVVTLYHLSDPSGMDPAGFDAQLDALVPRADRLFTLTDSAAAQVRHRWGVPAQVLPHPHAVDFVRMRRERPPRSRHRLLIGAHLGGLRFAADPVATAEALTVAVAKIPDARLDVRVHHHLIDPESTRYEPALIHDIDHLVREVGGTLRAERPMTDPQLWDYLYGLDVSFVPPLAGSHSIWPEAGFDLGTWVVMPRNSHAADQQRVSGYELASDGTPDITSLVGAFQEAYDRPEAPKADPSQRWKQRVTIAETLRRSYEELTGRSAPR